MIIGKFWKETNWLFYAAALDISWPDRSAEMGRRDIDETRLGASKKI